MPATPTSTTTPAGPPPRSASAGPPTASSACFPTTRGARSGRSGFETGTSPEARFARALDRFAGFLLNHASEGASWRENGVTADRVHARNERIGSGSPALWDEVQRRLADAVARGWVDAGPSSPPSGGTPG